MYQVKMLNRRWPGWPVAFSQSTREIPDDGRSPACANGYPSAAQQGTIASFLPLLDAKRPISSGSLVRIRSPERATSTTVASIGSSVRALARSAPASRPIFSSTGRTSTARRSLATPACLPPGLRHTCAITIALVRSSWPRSCATRSRAIIERSFLSTAMNSLESKTRALTGGTSSELRLRAPAPPGSIRQQSRYRASFPRYRGIPPTPPPGAWLQLLRLARTTTPCRPCGQHRVPGLPDRSRTKCSSYLLSCSYFTTLLLTAVVPTWVVLTAVRSKIERRRSWAALASHPPRRKSFGLRMNY